MNKSIKLTENSGSIKHLLLNDKKLSQLITFIGDYTLNLRTDYFSSLIRLIIGQQLSNKATASIWNRLTNSLKEITPKATITCDENILREFGISKSKISYIKNLSKYLINEKLDLNKLSKLNDSEQIRNILISIRGIGPWTADMFLIFSLGKMDILSYRDVSIKRAVKWLYELDDTPDDKFLKYLSDKWNPYQTIACLYLWEIVNRDLIRYDTPNAIFMNKK